MNRSIDFELYLARFIAMAPMLAVMAFGVIYRNSCGCPGIREQVGH